MRGLCVIALLFAACGPGQQSQVVSVSEDFDCKERRASYKLTGGFGNTEEGVAVSCENNRPTLTQYRVPDDGSARQEKTKAMSSQEFETLWEKIETTGWRHIEDCEYIGTDDDPVYEMEVGDYASSVKVTCAGRKLEFPYENLVNELQLKAAGIGGEFRTT